MSGGVGPTGGDIRLPEEEEPAGHHLESAPAPPRRRRRLLSFRQLKALALIVIFSASGMVSHEHFAFVFLSFFYVHFLARVAFPATAAAQGPLIFHKSQVLRQYIFVSAVIGLYLPIAYILGGVLQGDKEGIKAAAPHVFLLAGQGFMEGVAFSGKFSPPIWAFVPVFYHARRLPAIVEWLRAEVVKTEEERGMARRLHVGRWLAIANLLFWSFNLFGFLLPVYVPRVFQSYYGEKEKA